MPTFDEITRMQKAAADARRKAGLSPMAAWGRGAVDQPLPPVRMPSLPALSMPSLPAANPAAFSGVPQSGLAQVYSSLPSSGQVEATLHDLSDEAPEHLPNAITALGQAVTGFGANVMQAARTTPWNPMAAGSAIHRWAMDTPAAKRERQANQPAPQNFVAKATAGRPAAAGSGPINSYKDPRWTGMEQDVERLVGIPQGSLGLIRLHGERSNNDQTNSLGTASVYQITASTRKLLQDKYGWDAANRAPSNMAKGAALLIKEGIQRTGSLQGSIQQYHGGLDPSNYGPQNQSYMARINAALGETGGLSVGYDPSYANKALGELNRAEAAAMKPESFSYDVSGAPEMPMPEAVAATDFSKVDAALEALRPEEISEKEKLRTRRSEFFAGVGQALAALPEGAGIGKILAAVGGAGLAGKARGDAEVRAREDAYDEKMVRFNTLVANNELTKAKTVHEEAQHLADQQYGAALQKFKVDSDRYFSTNFGTVQGDSFVTSKNVDGKVTVTRTPISGAVQAAFAARRAEVFASQGSQYNSALGSTTQMRNAAILQAAGQQAAMTGAQADDGSGAIMGLATLAGDVVATGRAQGLVSAGNKDAWDALQEDVTGSLQSMGVMPGGAGYDEAYQQAMAERLVAEAAGNPKFREALMNAGGPASAVMEAKRRREGRTTVKTDNRGRQTRTESY